MKNKFRWLAAALSAVMCLSVFSGVAVQDVFADGDPAMDGEPIEYNGYTFTLDQDDGWYKAVDGLNREWRLLANAYIQHKEELSGKLPASGYYMLYEDITVTDGRVMDPNPEPNSSEIPLYIDFCGKTLTYDNPDTSEYMLDTSATLNTRICLVDYSVSKGGTIYDTNGAPLINLVSSTDPVNYFETSGLIVKGNADDQSSYSEKSPFSFVNGNHMIYGTTISGFKSRLGGAIYSTSNVYLSGSTITGCYAERGGAVYCIGDGVVSLSGSVIEKNTAAKCGSAIVLDGSYISSSSSTIRYNNCEASSADDEGGAVYVCNDAVRTHNSAFELMSGITYIADNTSANSSRQNIYFVEDYPDSTTPSFNIGKLVNISSKVVFSRSDYSVANSKTVFIRKANMYASDDYLCCLECEDPGYVYTVDQYDKTLYSMTASSDACYVLRGYSLSVDGNDIRVNYHISIPEGTNASLYDLKYQMSGYSKTGGYGNEDGLGQLDISRPGEIVFSINIDPMDMTRSITAYLSYDGKKVLTDTNFTVRNYIYAIYSNPSKYCSGDSNYGLSGQARAVATAIAMYGAASQKYFNFHTEDLADNFLDQSFKDRVIASLPSSYFENNTYTLDVKDSTSPVSYYGASMIFTSKPAMKFYFKIEDPNLDPAKLNIVAKTDNGLPYDGVISSLEGYYAFSPVTFSPKLCSENMVVTVTYDGVEMMTLTYAPINYLSRIYKNSSNEKMKSLAQSMLILYWASNGGTTAEM